jgi:hypothetical protein
MRELTVILVGEAIRAKQLVHEHIRIEHELARRFPPARLLPLAPGELAVDIRPELLATALHFFPCSPGCARSRYTVRRGSCRWRQRRGFSKLL